MRTPNKKESVTIEFIQELEDFNEEYWKGDSKNALIKNLFYGIAYAIKIVNLSMELSPASIPVLLKEGGIVPDIKYKKGGLIKGGLINLPDGSKIIPHNIAEQIVKENKKLNVNVILNGVNLNDK